MKRRALFSLLIALGCLFSHSQTDSVIFNKDVRLEDRIFLTYGDFRRMTGLKKEVIISTEEKEQLEFLTKVLYEEAFSYKEGETLIKAISKNVWGYLQNSTFYVNYKGDFYRVPVFGSISYLVANVTVINPGFYDPRFGYSTGSTTTKELREFLMNFYDGQIEPFTLSRAEELLSADLQLYAEYDKLSRRKKKEQIYSFLRKFNQAHPVYFQK